MYFVVAEVMLPPGRGEIRTDFQPGVRGEMPPRVECSQAPTEPRA